MNKTNPLQQFFRKPKFTILLPSRGKWYPKNTISSTNGEVEIYAMTASDDTRFKTSEILLSSKATYDLIKSCVPALKDPEQIPIVDLDVIMMSIRRASQGDQIKYNVSIPGTDKFQDINLSIEQLVKDFPNAEAIWDEELNISNESGNTLHLLIKPINLRTLFLATKQIIKQQQLASDITTSSSSNDEKINELDTQMKSLGNISVNMIGDSIRKVSTDEFTTENSNEIKQFIAMIDLEYFRSIQAHVDAQKEKLTFKTQTVYATPEQELIGAPKSWEVPINFNLSTFFE